MISQKQLTKFAKQQRRNLTPSEAAFRDKLKNAGIVHENHPVVGFYIPDFTIPSRILTIEIDGGYHLVEDQVQYDAAGKAEGRHRIWLILHDESGYPAQAPPFIHEEEAIKHAELKYQTGWTVTELTPIAP